MFGAVQKVLSSANGLTNRKRVDQFIDRRQVGFVKVFLYNKTFYLYKTLWYMIPCLLVVLTKKIKNDK